MPQNIVEVKENPEEQVAIGNIRFFSSEMQFDSIRDVFYSIVNNPSWKDDMIACYPYVYNGFGFNGIKGIFSDDNLLVGVVLSAMDNGHRAVILPDNMVALEKVVASEYGDHVDAHQCPSENDVRDKGEYAYKLWKCGNKHALMTLSARKDSENICVNLYIYRRDKIDLQQSEMSMDSEMNALKAIL